MGQLYIDTNRGPSGDPYQKGDNMSVQPMNGKTPNEKVAWLNKNWDVKKHQPYATHQSFVQVRKELAELKDMIKALVDKK